MNVEDDLLLAAEQGMREWAARKELQLIEQMRELDDEREQRGAAARERTTIHFFTWALPELFDGTMEWHTSDIAVHFSWKREPRWFD